MQRIHLVAVQHDDHGNLLCPNMYPLIQDQVVPLLTADCVLVVEGGNGRGKLTPDNPDYNAIFSQLGPICCQRLRPLIHADDPMHQQQNRDVPRHVKQLDIYNDLTIKLLRFGSLPNTWEEMVETIRAREHDVKMTGALSKQWQAFGVALREEFLERDNAFIGQIQMYADENKPVLFFGGVLHCLSLTALYGWPVVRYECLPTHVHGFYKAWFQVYGMPDLFYKKTSKG